MADTFPQDLSRAQDISKELNTIWEERQQKVTAGQSTGRFDHKIKAKDNELKSEVTNIEKLIYFYQNNDDKYS